MAEDRSWLTELADLLGTAAQSGIESPTEPLTTTMRGLASNNPFSGVASAFYGDDPRDVARPRLGKPKLYGVPEEGEPHIPEREGAVENRKKARAALPEPANAGVLPAGGTYRDPALQDAPLDTSSLDWSWGRGVALGEDGRPLRNSKVFDRASGNVTEDRSSIGGGGFAPSTQDWSRVANPSAFSAYNEMPERKLHEELAKDPLYVEKAKRNIDVERALMVAQGTSNIQNDAQSRDRLERMIRLAVIDKDAIASAKHIAEQPGFAKLTKPEQEDLLAKDAEKFAALKAQIDRGYGITEHVTASKFYDPAAGAYPGLGG